jgi:hypothetical protein
VAIRYAARSVFHGNNQYDQENSGPAWTGSALTFLNGATPESVVDVGNIYRDPVPQGYVFDSTVYSVMTGQTGTVIAVWKDGLAGSVLFAIDVNGNLRTANATAATTPGAVVKKLPVFDAVGNSLGFLPIYDSIS